MDPRRLADPAVAVPVRPDAPRHQTQFVPADLALEDPRQSPPQPRRADAARTPRRRLDRPAGRSLVLDRDRAGRDGGAAAAPGCADARRAAQGAILPGVLAQPPRGFGDRARADRPRRHVSRVSRLGHGARHRLDADPADDYEATSPRMGNSRRRSSAGGRHRRRPRAARIRRRHDRQPHHRRGRGAARLDRSPGGPVLGTAVRGTVGDRARCRVLAEPAGGAARAAAHRSRAPAAAQDGPEDVAVLRDIRHGGRRVAAARQLPGSRRAATGQAHFPDQHRHDALVDAGRARSRVPDDRDVHSSARRYAHDARRARAP